MPTSELLQTIAAYVPPSIVRATLDDPAPAPPTYPTMERILAAVLFVDVSGFTPLTEILAQKGAEGPEELTRLLNRYFSWMIAFIEVEGGEVMKFGGDALIAVFPAINEDLGRATRRAYQSAETMQSVMDEFNTIESSAGLVVLTMRIGIGAGEVMMARVGGMFDHWEYIMAGDPLHQATQAQHQARQGQIALSPSARAVIVPDLLPPYRLSRPDWAALDNLTPIEATLRCYVPTPVLAWLDEDLHGWLATLRPMSVLFVGVYGLDYQSPQVIDRLHAFVRGAQVVIQHYQGSLARLTVDDKGTVLLILFGTPPSAHEDDAERALRCALDLQTLAQEEHDLQLAVGVTTGRVFAGPVGGVTRQEYTVMGDTVNLAARLMIVIGPGQICCTYETYRNTRGQVNFDLLPPVQIKGKAGLVRLYRAMGYHRPLNHSPQVGPVGIGQTPLSSKELMGRQAELARLAATLAQVQAGQGRIVVIEGEAGIGKSRLVEAFMEMMTASGLTPLRGWGRSIEQNQAYHGWQDIFITYFGLELDPAETHRDSQNGYLRQLQTWLNQVAPALTVYLPLLNDLLNLALPANDTTAGLDIAARHDHLVTLLTALLRAWAIERPLALIFEDAHWLDPDSWDVAARLTRDLLAEQLPLLLVVVVRPLVGQALPDALTTLINLAETDHLRLDSLPTEEILNLAAAKLVLTGNDLPEAVAELVQQRAGGNPFFAEELIYALHDYGFITLKTIHSLKGMASKTRCLLSGDLDQAMQLLPATIQSTVLARLDRLPPEQQLMLKIAAVIGQSFTYSTLSDTLNQYLEMDGTTLQTHLYDLVYLGLIEPISPESPPVFRFKHIIIREVTYQSLLFDRRRQLHRAVAEWYERTYSHTYNDRDVRAYIARLGTSPLTERPDPAGQPLTPASTTLALFYPLLVYHWHQAEDEERERYYAILVGQQAVAQFANTEALAYLNRALELTPPADLTGRYKLLLAREMVYDRLGKRVEQGQDLAMLIALVQEMKSGRREVEVLLRQARYAQVTNNYAAALNAAQQAAAQAKQIQVSAYESGAHIAWASILYRQSDHSPATNLLQQALAQARAGHDSYHQAAGLYHLGLLVMFQGDYPLAQTHCTESLAICSAQHYAAIEADNLNLLGLIRYYLGDTAAARDYYEQALFIVYTIGDRRGELKPFYNIGLIELRQGNYEISRDYFEQALDIAREIGDQTLAAEALSSLGVVYCYLGDHRMAQSYQTQALDIREEIGNIMGQADSLSKLGVIYHHLGDLGTTRRYSELALALQQKCGDRAGQSHSLTWLGHAWLGLGHFDNATAAYEQAVQLRRQLGQAALALEALAGLAQVALQQGQVNLALTRADEIVTWLSANGLAGLDQPFQVCLSVYQVLSQAAPNEPPIIERSRDILEMAHTALQQRAAGLSDILTRRRFLENVKIHREIIAAWEGCAALSLTT